MASNTRPFNLEGARDLLIADIAVGDELVQVVRRGNSWGAIGTRTEVIWTVEKVLKTRLQLGRDLADGRHISLRVLVDNRKWAYAAGRVQTSLEGQGSSWRTDGIYLYTPDGLELVADRKNYDTRAEEERVKVNAREKLESFKKSLNIEDAEAAIQALQEYIDNKEKNA